MRYERPPSKQQREIIEEPNLEIPLKIIAGAGTGKTFVLAHRFVWLVVERGLPADRILALTFSDNAAIEMRTRIRQILRRNNVPPPATIWVHTFHSFAARLLRENAYRAGRDPEPTLITEIEEALYLSGLVEEVFEGELATKRALDPGELAQLGVDKPESLRNILLALVRQAKGRGLPPEKFRAEAKAQAEKFWGIVPTAAEGHAMDPDELAAVIYQRAAAAYGLPPLPPSALPKDLTYNLRRLYYVGLRPPVPRTDTQALFDAARKAEEGLIEAATEMYALYLQRLETERALDFDGQIAQAVTLLGQDEESLAKHYREYFQYLLVDEFQDTSLSQLELVRLLARPRRVQIHSPTGEVRTTDCYARLLVVGDRKQSIYGWRNARPENIDDLLPIAPGETVEGHQVCRPLTESYRLTAPIVEIANRAGAAACPTDPALLPANPAQGRLIWPAPFADTRGVRHNRRAEAAYIADQIVRLRDCGEIGDLSEVAVLVRKRSAFRALKVEFERRNLLYQAEGGVGFFEHPLARDTLAWLQVLRDPHQDLYLTRLLTRAPYALSDRELYLLLTEPQGDTRQRRRQSAMEIVLESVAEGKMAGRPEAPAVPGTGRAERKGEAREVVAGLLPRLCQFVADYDRLRDLGRAAPAREVLEAIWRHCMNYVSLTRSEELATDVVYATFEGVIEQVSGREEAPLHDLVNALNLYLDDDNRELPVADQPLQGAVRVMTIHRAKGLGFPVVFLLGWTENRRSGPALHSLWGVQGIKINSEDPKGLIRKFLKKVVPREGSAESSARAVRELHGDESLNLAYVGLTRGERLLCVTRATNKNQQLPEHPAGAYFTGVPEAAVQVGAVAESGTAPVRPATVPVVARRLAGTPPLIRVSFTQLRRLEQCPRWWLLARQAPAGLVSEELPNEESGAQVGQRFHRFVAGYYRGAGPRVETEGLSEPEARRLEGLMAAFLDSEWSRLTEPVEVEVPVALGRKVGELQVILSGVVDLLLPQTGRLADFKTDREMPAAVRADHALQLLIYRQALRGEGIPPACLLLHVRPEALETLVLAEEELQTQALRLERLLESLGEYVAGRPAEAEPGEHCRWCDFQGMCAAR